MSLRKLVPISKLHLESPAKPKSSKGNIDYIISYSVFSFSVAQFNILAQSYALHQWFSYCKPEVLEWETRGPRLIKCISELKADILCLEVMCTKI